MTGQAPEPLLFDRREDAQEWVASVYDAAWQGSLTSEQRTAFAAIKSGLYAPINRFLRTGRAGPLPSKRQIQRWVADARAGLQVKPVPEALTVFRGLSLLAVFDEMEPHELVGGQVRDPAFVSTTLWLPIALRFGADVLVITVPAGTPAAWLDAFEQRNELEILLPPGTTFQITGSDFESGRRILNMTVVV